MNLTIKKTTSRLGLPVVILFGLLFVFTGVPVPSLDNLIVRDVEARVGRPATPGSVAGVGRRTTRRTVRRHIAIGTRVWVLPGGCTTVVRHNVHYHHCGVVYYRPYYEGTTKVYVVVEEP